MTGGPITPVARIDVVGAANALFDTLATALVQQGITIPDIAGIVPGAEVAFDGEQFTVNFVRISGGVSPSPEAGAMHRFQVRQYYDFEVNLIREIAGLEQIGGSTSVANAVPTMEAMGKDFARLADDAAALWASIVAVHTSYAIVGPNIPFQYGPLIPLAAQGGLSGCRLPVSWQAL